ncbi:PIG-L family deacetylase [bacterium]|nr:PIG-L family deacetylase [bacterium]
MTTSQGLSKKIVALAAAAHADDIEFMMAGTLLLLKEAGAEIHMWNLSNGHCGSNTLDTDEIICARWSEAQDSARLAGAIIHPPITGDIDIIYEKSLIARVGSVIRAIKPSILLIPSPHDYMEDHQNACRLLVTGAFTRGMRNYVTDPPVDPYTGPVALYHAMPHGLRDSLRKRIRPGQYVDITGVLAQKRDMLSQHRSQKEWLDESQGIGAYITLMESFARELGSMSGRFGYAEGWRRHAHWGFAAEDFDPLSDILSEACYTDPEYEQSLES